jgi:glutamate synthase domain-containing protein 1
MCGIVGLFLKDKSMEAQLGAMLTDMLITMTDRGPDSAGIAIYSKESTNIGKLTVQSDTPNVDFKQLKDATFIVTIIIIFFSSKNATACVAQTNGAPFAALARRQRR